MSRRFRLILIGVAIVAIALVAFFFLINPIRGDITDVQADIDEQDTLIAAAEREVGNADEIQRQGRADEARLIELAKMMPDSGEVPSLILQVQDLADRSGIEWIQVSPGAVSGAEDAAYLTLPLSLNFSGNYYDVSDFIYRAEQMVAGPGRLLTVKNLTLSPIGESGSGSPVLDVRMTLLAFVMPTDNAAPADESATTESTETTETTESTE